MSGVGLLAAAGAGLLSFLSPCVLPLIPAYLSMISGYAVADIRSGAARARTLGRSLAFVAGFGLVFSGLGLVFSSAALLLGGAARIVTIASGCIIALLGLNLVFDFIKLLRREARPLARLRPAGAGAGSRGGVAGSFLLGIAFGAGWTPCVGPILASILLLASQEGEGGRALLLLATYSLGLGLPFIAAGLFLERITPLLDWFKRHGKLVRITSGLMLVALGVLMASGKLGLLSSSLGAGLGA